MRIIIGENSRRVTEHLTNITFESALAFFSQWSGNGLISYYLNVILAVSFVVSCPLRGSTNLQKLIFRPEPIGDRYHVGI